MGTVGSRGYVAPGRLYFTLRQVRSRVAWLYHVWSSAGHTESPACKPETVHEALVSSLGMAWVETWIGTKTRALVRIGRVIHLWVKDLVKTVFGLSNRPSQALAKLEQRLRAKKHVVPAEGNAYAPGVAVWARWINEADGSLERYAKGKHAKHHDFGTDGQPGPVPPNKRGKETNPGWHPGWVEGPDPRKPNAYRVKYKEDDGSVSRKRNVRRDSSCHATATAPCTARAENAATHLESKLFHG